MFPIMFTEENFVPDFTEEPSSEPSEEPSHYVPRPSGLKQGAGASSPNLAYLAFLAPVIFVGGYIVRRLYRRRQN